MKIAVDVDDVLTHTGVKYIKYHNERYGTELGEDQFYDRDSLVSQGVTRAEASQRVLDYVRENILDIAPMEGAKEVLQENLDKHEFIVLTGRPESMLEKTKQWVEIHYPKIFSGVFSTDMHQVNGGRNKGDLCKELGAKLLIEDYLIYAKECTREKIRVLLLAQPWNVNEKIESELITRVNSWEEIEKELQKNSPNSPNF